MDPQSKSSRTLAERSRMAGKEKGYFALGQENAYLLVTSEHEIDSVGKMGSSNRQRVQGVTCRHCKVNDGAEQDYTNQLVNIHFF